MIISKTPLRVTIGGGGTDLPSFYKNHGGFVISVAIKKYMYICINRSKIIDSIRIKYSKSEDEKKLENIKHDIAKQCLKEFKINNDIEVVSVSDVPAGSGLGSSSAYAVGLIKCLSKLKKNNFTDKKIAETACKIEIDKLKKPIGKQDQYISSYGGLKKIIISKKGNVSVNNIEINDDVFKKFENSTLMFYTGDLRNNDKILSEQKEKMDIVDDSSVSKIYREIKDIGKEIYKELLKGNMIKIGQLFDDHWHLKKKLARGITSELYDDIYLMAKNNGAIGGKITGAGGGGFFTFICKENKRNKLIKKMEQKGFKNFEFRIEKNGSKIFGSI